MKAINISSLRKIEYKKAIIFLCGFFSTMPIIALPIFGRYISLFSVFFLIEMAFLVKDILAFKKVQLGFYIKKYLLWLFIAMISSCCGLVISLKYPELRITFSYIPKILIYIVFAISWKATTPIDENNNALCRGLLYGCIINMIWGIVDASGWYIAQVSISNNVFSGYMIANKLNYIGLPQASGLYRTGGLNYDPAHLGFLCPFLTLYSLKTKKYKLVLLSFGGLLASASTTGFVCSGLIVFIWMIKNHLSNKRKQAKSTTKKIVACTVFVVSIIIVVIVFRASIVKVVSKAVNLFYDRVTTTYLNQSDDFERAGGPRADFIRYLPEAVCKVGPFMFFGTGLGTSSYGYTHTEYVAQALGKKQDAIYDIENTYLAYLLDTGILGFGLFFYFMIKAFSFFKKKCKYKGASLTDYISYAGIVAMLLSFLFYHYILFAPQMLLLVVALTQADGNDSFDEMVKIYN